MSDESNTQSKDLADSIIRKVHATGGNEALDAFMRSKGSDLPVMNLSAREIELLSNSGWWTFICTLFGNTSGSTPDLPHAVEKFSPGPIG